MAKAASDLSRLLKARAELDEELRRHKTATTILFTDVVGSTSYFERFGDTAGLAMVHRHAALTSQAVGEYQGIVIKTIGDSVMARFDQTISAVNAAVETQRRLLVLNGTLPERERIQLRIGIHHGQAFSHGSDAFGDVVNFAARITKKSAPGQILVSGAVHEVIEQARAFPCRPIGKLSFAGKSEPQDLYEVVWTAEETYSQLRELLGPAVEDADLLMEPEGTPAAPASDTTLVVGGRIGCYEVLAFIGRGGMGEVYRARDTRLNREVALKVLPAPVAHDAQRLARFRREAHLLAALNHSNIATIHGMEESGHSQALVMELVEGATLAERLAAGPLLLEEALTIAGQLATALEYAHEKGVIHRDLKPANIKITPDGSVKVLDFGLAKALEDGTPAGHPDESPTLSAAATKEGIILGTAAYMSPEQAKGKQVDTRADVWAFGVVLFELLTGRRMFAADTASETLAAVMMKDPDWRALPRKTPERIRQLLQRCLEKDPRNRLRDIGEARVIIEKHLANPHPAVRRIWPVAAVAGALLVLVLAGAVLLFRTPPRRAELKWKRLTTNPSERPVRSAAISPDGKYLAYGDPAGVHLQVVDTGETKLVTQEIALPMSWFPDGGRFLAVTPPPQGALLSMSLLGGMTHRLREHGVAGAIVAPDGTKIALELDTMRADGGNGDTTRLSELWVMGANGEDARKLVTLPQGVTFNSFTWSPDNTRIAYVLDHRGKTRVESCDLNGGRPKPIILPGDVPTYLQDLLWLSDSRLLFAGKDSPGAQAAALYEVPMQLRTASPTGPAVRLGQSDAQLWSLASSRDSRRVSLIKGTNQTDVYVGELEAGGARLKTPRRLTLEDSNDLPEVWTPDSQAVIFSSDRNGQWGIFRQNIDSDSADRLIGDPPGNVRVSPDGNWIIYDARVPGEADSSPARRLLRMPITGGPGEFLLSSKNFSSFRCSLPPSTLCVLVEREGNQRDFTSFDAVQGRGRRLFRLDGSLVGWDIRPDGQRLAIMLNTGANDRFAIFDLNGRQETEVILKDWPGLGSLDYAADGKSIYVTRERSGKDSALLRVNDKGKVDVLWQSKSQLAFWAVPSPNGRYLAILNGTESYNAWLVELGK